MFKRFLILIIILFNLIFFNTSIKSLKAASLNEVEKTLIVLKGKDYSQYLEYNGYKMLESNVNFNECGKYIVKYENLSNNTIINKNVYVQSEEELTNGNILNESYQSIYSLMERSVLKKVIKVDGAYYISLSEENSDETFNMHFIKIINNKVVFDKIIYSNTKGSIVDFVINNQEIALLINKENGDNKQDAFVVFMDKVGNITLTRQYSGIKIEEAKRILYDDDNYYIIIKSMSSSINGAILNFSFYGVVCFGIDRQTKDSIGYDSYCYDRDLFVEDAIIRGNKVLILTYRFDRTIMLKRYEIHEIDTTTMNLGKIYCFNQTIKEFPIKMCLNDNNDLFIATKEESLTKLYKITSDYQKILIDSYTCNGVSSSNLVDFLVTGTDELIFLYNLIDTTQSDQYGYLYQIIKGKKVETEIINFSSVSNVVGLVDLNEVIFFKNNILTINKISFANFSDFAKENNIVKKSDLKLPSLYVDGKKVLLDEGKSSYNFDINNYGIYDAVYYFSTAEFDIITFGIINVLPNINVSENEVYDLNTIISFNGAGVINDYNINSGYILNRPGEYELIVYGKQLQKRVVNFRVEKLSDNSEKTIVDDIKIETSEIVDMPYNTLDINNQTVLEELETKEKSNLWMMIIPGFAFVFLVMTIIKKRG